MQIAKSLLEKAKADHKDPYLSLLEYRNTPVDNFKTPAQLLMSRRLRSVLPCTHQQLKPKVVSHRDTHHRRVHCQKQQKRYYNRSAKPLSALHTGQNIRFQENGHWKPAVVVRTADTARSYHIQTPDGAEYRRNRRHLLDTKEVPITRTDVNTDVQGASDSAQHPAPTPPAPKAATYLTRSGREVRPRDILDL